MPSPTLRAHLSRSLIIAALTLTVATVASAQTFSVRTRTDMACAAGPVWVEIQDLNNDGVKDLFTANYNSSSVSVFLGNGAGGFLPRTDYATGIGAFTVRAADLNNDLKIDLLVANFAGGSVSVLLGNGDGTFQPAINTPTGAGCAVAKGGFDLNGDSYADVVTANYNANTMSVLFGNGTGGFTSKTDYATGVQPNWVSGADLDGDGDVEWITANYGGSSISYFKGNGDGTFQPKVDYPMGANPVTLTLGDFNGDNVADVATANNGAGNISVRLTQPLGGFGARTDFAATGGPITITSGDLNMDGKIDIVTCNETTNNVSVLIGNGTGGFLGHVDYAVGTLPQGVAIGDATGDGEPDIVSANQTTNNITLLTGNVPGGFAVNDTAAALTALDQANVSRALASFSGKWVMLDICPQWCPPCNFMATFTQPVYDTWVGHLPFEFVTAIFDQATPGKGSTQQTATQWGQRYNITRPILHENGSDHGMIRQWRDGSMLGAYPMRIIIDPAGKIRKKDIGALPSAQDVVNEIATLAGVAAPTVPGQPPPPSDPSCKTARTVWRAMQSATIEVSYGPATTSIALSALITNTEPECINSTVSHLYGGAASCVGTSGPVGADVYAQVDSTTGQESIDFNFYTLDQSAIQLAQPWQVKIKNIAWVDGLARVVAATGDPTVYWWNYDGTDYVAHPTTIDPVTTVIGNQVSLTSFPLGNVPDILPTASSFSFSNAIVRHQSLLAVGDRDDAGRIELAAPSPNPALRTSTIRWSMTHAGDVRLTIVDVAGRQVRELARGTKPAGEHTTAWDLRDEANHRVGPGVYFVALSANGVEHRTRLVVLE